MSGIEVPRDLYGRRERDRMWGMFSRAAALYERASRSTVRKRPLPQRKSQELDVCISARTPVADGVMSIVLTGDCRLPEWRPGSHIDVILPSGRMRQYSICNSPRSQPHYRIAVRQVGAASAELHTLPIGTRLRIRLPRNGFPFIAASEYLFVAGGIGITALLPMIEAAHDAGASYSIVYTGRSPAFTDELARFRNVTLSAERLAPRPVPAQTVVYCCGPAGMIAAWQAVTPGPFFAERFTPPVVTGANPFTITLARSGRTVQVPGDRSALDVLREVVPSIAYSCQQGFCGTCRIGDMLPCIERPGEHIVLDL